MRLNLATQSGWILSEAYREYRAEGGTVSPSDWNKWIRELQNAKQRIRSEIKCHK